MRLYEVLSQRVTFSRWPSAPPHPGEAGNSAGVGAEGCAAVDREEAECSLAT